MPLDAALPIVNQDGTMTDSFRSYMLEVDGVTGTVPWIGNIRTDEGLQFAGVGLGAIGLYATTNKGDIGVAAKPVLLSGTSAAMNATTGNVDISTAAGVAVRATSSGSVRAPLLGTGSGQTLEWNATAGELVRNTSSVAYKEEVEDYPDALGELMKLRPRVYRRKDTGEVEAGFIAEEVHEAGLSKYVVYDSEDKPIGIRYGQITALLTAVLQDIVGGTL